MKHLLLIAFLVMAGTAFAQKNTVVGKWGFASISTPDITVDLENPAEAKKYLVEQVKKESGTTPDSAQIEMAYTMMTSMFNQMTFEFNKEGKATFSAVGMDGSTESETVQYTVDYDKGTLTTIEMEDGKEKKETMKIRFEGDYLYMTKAEKNETIKVKKVK